MARKERRTPRKGVTSEKRPTKFQRTKITRNQSGFLKSPTRPIFTSRASETHRTGIFVVHPLVENVTANTVCIRPAPAKANLTGSMNPSKILDLKMKDYPRSPRQWSSPRLWRLPLKRRGAIAPTAKPTLKTTLWNDKSIKLSGNTPKSTCGSSPN